LAVFSALCNAVLKSSGFLPISCGSVSLRSPDNPSPRNTSSSLCSFTVSTKTFTSELSVLAQLALRLSKKRGKISQDEMDSLSEKLLKEGLIWKK